MQIANDQYADVNHIKFWAIANWLLLTVDKTKELVFRRPNVRAFHLTPKVDSTEQVTCSKLFGVMFQPTLKMDAHVQHIVYQCPQRLYLLKLLRQQGMSPDQLSMVWGD